MGNNLAKGQEDLLQDLIPEEQLDKLRNYTNDYNIQENKTI